MDVKYQQYLQAVAKPFKKLAKLEFLQPDNSVAFTLDNNYRRGFRQQHDTRAFIQSGTLNVSLNNGQRRKATITLANIDNQFSYNVNNLWFGNKLRLSMGLVLPDGTDFYLPQGVFYINNPQNIYKPAQSTVTLNLVDKWAYLDGSLFGTFANTFQINALTNGVSTNIFDAMQSLLHLSKINFSNNAPSDLQIDNVQPVFTTFYNNRTYQAQTDEGETRTVNATDVPYDMISDTNIAKLMLELNSSITGLIGYDQTGALRVEPSQNDINDSDKPIVWAFSPENSQLLGITETFKNSEVYNDIVVIGEGLTGYEVWGRATNFDIRSDTNAKIIGRKTLKEAQANYWNTQQCVDYATWLLKRKTVLQKSITIESTQLFHLIENRLVSVKRTDKQGNPTENHIIQSFSLPIGETGNMTINCTSVVDFPIATIITSGSGT